MPTGQQNRAEDEAIFRHLALHSSATQRAEVYKSILNSRYVGVEYVALHTLAGLTTLFGFLENMMSDDRQDLACSKLSSTIPDRTPTVGTTCAEIGNYSIEDNKTGGESHQDAYAKSA